MTPAAERANPRVTRTRQAILEATLDELAEVGYGALTIESVAARAGASKATIYRHWDGKLDLFTDAVATLKSMPTYVEADDPYDSIVAFFEAVATHVGHGRFSACIPAVIEASITDPGVHEFHVRSTAERQAYGAAMLDAARDAGHLDDDVDTATMAERLVAPIFFRRIMTAAPFPVDEVRSLVDAVLGPFWR
ncbi:MAG: TetR/AcrR family transcriptional regulator [Acidimicrobiales bacterium]|nr:TetR/AcrR family transcriptional regulator [Acidimicrobiales bacterium]